MLTYEKTKLETFLKKKWINIFYNIEVIKMWYENQEAIKGMVEKRKGKPFRMRQAFYWYRWRANVGKYLRLCEKWKCVPER